jgi:hypothetical protein
MERKLVYGMILCYGMIVGYLKDFDLALFLVDDINEADKGTRGLTKPMQFHNFKGFFLLHRSFSHATIMGGKFGYSNL